MIFSSEKLERAYSYKFNGLIWRIEIQEKKKLLAIESRELESKRVYFSVLNLHTGEVYFKEKAFAEPMNANLAHLSEHHILLKLNEHSEVTESKGLLAIDISSAEVVWEKYNYGLEQATSYGLKVYDARIYPRRFSWIDHKTASIIPAPEIQETEFNSILFPELINNYSFPEFITHKLIEGAVSELKINDLHIICFHEKLQKSLQQRLLIHQNGKVLHEDYLIKNIQKLQPESFFIINKQLFYIRNKNEIVSYFV